MSHVKEGQQVPHVVMPVRTDDGWDRIDTRDFFKGRTVVVFALPGAFTPTCSSSHLPRYNELVDEFARRGVDAVACVSVNDTFVMNAWARSLKADRVVMLPDGTGSFTEQMGMLVDKSYLGFGKRSRRYSMLVRDGVIEKMFVEPDVEGDPFTVSDADTMLRYLDPDAKLPEPVLMFVKPGCPFCRKAADLLTAEGMRFETIEVGGAVTPSGLRAVSGAASTPQIFVGGKHIGGADDLEQWLSANRG
jgi:glutaredoxin-like protein